MKKAPKHKHRAPREILDSLPKTVDFFPLIDCIKHYNCLLRGSASNLTKLLGNLQGLIKPMRKSFYLKVGITKPMHESYPEYDYAT